MYHSLDGTGAGWVTAIPINTKRHHWLSASPMLDKATAAECEGPQEESLNELSIQNYCVFIRVALLITNSVKNVECASFPIFTLAARGACHQRAREIG